MPPTETSAPEGAWLDEGESKPRWPAPVGDPPDRSASGGLVYGGIALALVLVIAAIWGFGGFERRTDLLRKVAPDTLITTGPYEFRFTEATAQAKTDSAGAITGWEIAMIGEARTTEDTSISPDALGNDGMLVSKDDVSGEIAEPDSTNYGRDQSYERNQLTPGLPLIAYTVTFKYAKSYQPQPTIRLAISELIHIRRTWPARKRAGRTGPIRSSTTYRFGYSDADRRLINRPAGVPGCDRRSSCPGGRSRKVDRRSGGAPCTTPRTGRAGPRPAPSCRSEAPSVRRRYRRVPSAGRRDRPPRSDRRTLAPRHDATPPVRRRSTPRRDRYLGRFPSTSVSWSVWVSESSRTLVPSTSAAAPGGCGV